MADRPDTGAREPQDELLVPFETTVREALEKGERDDRLLSGRDFDETVWRLAENALAALAAGVGVPPDKDSEANSADYAEIRARAERLTQSIWGEPTRAEQAGLDVLTLLDVLASGASAHPERSEGALPKEPQWGKPYTDALQAEVGRLREQLDAARELLDKHLPYLEHSAYGSDREVASQLRAALGDVAAAPNQTTDSVGALGQKASETRATADKEAL